MKKLLTFTLSVSLLLTGIAGCGANTAPASDTGTASNTAPASDADSASNTAPASDAGPAAASTDSKDPVNLRFAWWGGQSRNDYTLKLIEMYEKLHPNVKIEPEYSSFDDQWKKLVPQAAANDLPDIIQMSVSYISQYGEKGQIIDLAPYIKNGLLDTSSISDNFLTVGQFKGKQYQITLGVNAPAVVVNPKMISDSGAAVPGSDWTWDDAEAIGAKLHDSGKMLAGSIHIRNFFDFYVRSRGGNLFSDDGSGLGYSDDTIFTDYFTRLKKMYDAGYMLSMDKQAQKQDVIEQDEMVLGNAAASFTWSNLYVAGSALVKSPLDILPPPGPDNQKSIFLMSSQGLSVANNSKNKEEAVKFVNWMINDIEANKIIKGERGVPISSKVQEAIKPLLSPAEQKMMDYVAWVGENAVSNRPIDPVGAVEVEKLLNDTGQQILYNKISVQDAAAKFRKDATAILKRNQ